MKFIEMIICSNFVASLAGSFFGSKKLNSCVGGLKMGPRVSGFKLNSTLSSKEGINNIPLTLEQKEVLTGLLLSDGMLTNVIKE